MKKIYISIIIAVVALVSIWYVAGNMRSVMPVTKAQSIELKNGDMYDLTASYVSKEIGGKTQKMLAYNGSIPGPTINVEQGAEVTINFRNDTDIPQLLHSHGVRMDNQFDGSQSVQKEIPPGETFSYTLKFPDAGIYWYHPHVEEVFGQSRGLYGAFVVKPKDSTYYPKVHREVPLILSDVLLENGKIATEKNDQDHMLMGHYGNVQLVNGEENYVLEAKQGEVVRMHVINAANARPFNFAIAGVKMKLIGGDSGAYEKATYVDSIILGTSERAIIDVFFENAGSFMIQNKTPQKTYLLGTVEVSEEKTESSFTQEFNTLQTNKATIMSIDPFRKYFDAVPTKNITLTIDIMGGMGGTNHDMHSAGTHMMPDRSMMNADGSSSDGIEWEDTMSGMNQMMTGDMMKWKIVDNATGRENMDINWEFEKDTPVKIRIFNDPKSMHPMQHPIHFHGQRFLVVARNGVKETNLVWKDTVLVKAGDTVDIILDPSNIGNWMAHCHISEHLAGGMMLNFKVSKN